LLVAFVLCNNIAVASKWRPVVLMHGLLDQANGGIINAAKWIQQDFPGIYVTSIEIGDGRLDSLIMGMNDQVDAFAQAIQSDVKLQNGFNLIGHSQGGLITRGYVERYNDPPVHNLISWAGPQMGQFGMPGFNAICPDPDTICDFFLDLMDLLMAGHWVDEWMQNHFSFASYWKDPFAYEKYLKYNKFLSDINNEHKKKNSTYKANLMSLNAYVLEYTIIDNTVIPASSPWFQFYDLGQDETITPWNETELYKHDWIGTRSLYQANKLYLYQTDCNHKDFPSDVCKKWYDLYTKPFLNNTMLM